MGRLAAPLSFWRDNAERGRLPLRSHPPGDEAHVGVESLSDALQCPGRRARGTALDAADVALVDAAALGELRLPSLPR